VFLISSVGRKCVISRKLENNDYIKTGTAVAAITDVRTVNLL